MSLDACQNLTDWPRKFHSLFFISAEVTAVMKTLKNVFSVQTALKVAFTLGCHCAQSYCCLFTEVTWPPCYWAFKLNTHMLSIFPRAPALIAAIWGLGRGLKVHILSHLSLCCFCVFMIYSTFCPRIVRRVTFCWFFFFLLAYPSQHLSLGRLCRFSLWLSPLW